MKYLLFLFLTGCSLFQYKELYQPNANDFYRHDLKVKVNGVDFIGVGVAALSTSYKISVYPEGKINRIMWRTCNREEVVDEPSNGWFSSKYEFELKPVSGLEDITSCGLQITVLEEKKRRNGFAFIDFQDKRVETSIPSILICNGVTRTYSGVSVCQSAQGLYQQISFTTPVVQRGSSLECDVMKPLNGDEKVYRFSVAKGECSYYFVAKDKAPNGKRYIHRLTTIGYTDVPPIKL